MKIARSTISIFALDLVPVLAGILLIIATMAFVFIPWSIGAHPGETIVVGNQAYHPS